jgi:hypothetical protein
MNNPSFGSALHAFSSILETIPQDNIPTNLINEATHILELLQINLGQISPISEGQFPELGISPLSQALSIVWAEQWNRQHPEETILINVAMMSTTEEFNSEEILNFRNECNHFVAGCMVDFLNAQNIRIPPELSGFLEEGQGGQKEVK